MKTPGVPTWKRVLDVSAVIVAAPILLPLSALIAAMIKCVSKGPIFFKQERVGYQGVRFSCWKFRSMRVGSDSRIHEEYMKELVREGIPMTKMDQSEDGRLIPGARFLRAVGLDELPQLINVVRGEMSLVGPRPCMVSEYENYGPSQKRRFEAVPGLTGLWQVCGKNKTSFTRMVELDIDYVERQSLTLDIRILVCTVPALMRQIGETCWRRKVVGGDETWGN